jgi:hypothetical protein
MIPSHCPFRRRPINTVYEEREQDFVRGQLLLAFQLEIDLVIARLVDQD